MTTNFDLFRQEKRWVFSKSSTIEVVNQSFAIDLSNDFKTTFPTFADLISHAEIMEVKVNGELFRLFAWTNKDGEKFGWLADTAKFPKQRGSLPKEELLPDKGDLLQEHLLLIENVGGIEERWNTPDDDALLTWAKNFFFGLSRCFKIRNQECVYGEDGWIFDPVENPLDISKLVCFSEEANGNKTFYHKETAEVFLLLHDHCFEYVSVLEGHPEYSFYTINGVRTFVDYVELLGKQILTCLK